MYFFYDSPSVGVVIARYRVSARNANDFCGYCARDTFVLYSVQICRMGDNRIGLGEACSVCIN